MGLSSINENRYQYSANFRVKQGERRCRLVTVESRRSSQKKNTTKHHCDRGSRRERCSDRSHVQGASAGRCQDSTCKGNRRGCRLRTIGLLPARCRRGYRGGTGNTGEEGLRRLCPGGDRKGAARTVSRKCLGVA